MGNEEQSLRNVVEAADAIAGFLSGVDEARFCGDELLRSAIRQKLTVMGEAAGSLGVGFRDTHPAVAWEGVLALRDLGLSADSEADNAAVWATAREGVPGIRDSVAALLGEGVAAVEAPVSQSIYDDEEEAEPTVLLFPRRFDEARLREGAAGFRGLLALMPVAYLSAVILTVVAYAIGHGGVAAIIHLGARLLLAGITALALLYLSKLGGALDTPGWRQRGRSVLSWGLRLFGVLCVAVPFPLVMLASKRVGGAAVLLTSLGCVGVAFLFASNLAQLAGLAGSTLRMPGLIDQSEKAREVLRFFLASIAPALLIAEAAAWTRSEVVMQLALVPLLGAFLLGLYFMLLLAILLGETAAELEEMAGPHE